MTRWQAFRFISDALRSMMRRETLAIDAEQVSWDVVLRLASEHSVTPTLAWALRNARPLPDEVRDYLDVTLDLNRRRNEPILDCLESALAALNSAGCEPLLLKGGAALVEELYPHPSVRYLRDLDILVPKSRLPDALVTLNKIDFRPIPAPNRRWVRPRSPSDFHHLPALFNEGAGVIIELHRYVGAREFEPILSTDTVLERRNKRSFRGLDLFAPCPTDMITHNIVHSQLHHSYYERGTVELRQLFELVLLTAKFAREIDWVEVEDRFRTTGHLEVLQRQAAIVQTIFSFDLKISGKHDSDYLSLLQSRIDLVKCNVTLFKIMANYYKGFLHDPMLAINLLNPLWWPGRIWFICNKLRAVRTTAGSERQRIRRMR
jgi:hypothetical protein